MPGDHTGSPTVYFFHVGMGSVDKHINDFIRLYCHLSPCLSLHVTQRYYSPGKSVMKTAFKNLLSGVNVSLSKDGRFIG